MFPNQVTPDLLKGQQELSADPPEEATKQILFTCLKNGTADDDPTTQRKVKLLLDNISELKSKAAESASATGIKALQEKRAALEKEVAHLKQKLGIEIKVQNNPSPRKKAFQIKANIDTVLRFGPSFTYNLLKFVKTRKSSKGATHCMKVKPFLCVCRFFRLTQMKTERERAKAEMKDLQQQLSEMHDELDRAKKTDVINTEKEVLLQDLAQMRVDFQEMLQVKEEQEEVLHHREMELSALKGALKEEVETHDKYIAALKEEYELELEKLLVHLQQAKEVRETFTKVQLNAYLGQEVAQVEEEKGAAKVQLKELIQERDNLKGKVRELSNKVEQLNQAIQEFKTTERMMEQRTKHSRLFLIQSKLTKLNHEHKDLKEKLKEERKQVEELWKMKAELEDERRMQDRAMEQLQRKMNTIMEECEASTDVLQHQVDEARERSQRELAELRRQLQEKGAELEKSRQAAKKLQEEVWHTLCSIQQYVLVSRMMSQRQGGEIKLILEHRTLHTKNKNYVSSVCLQDVECDKMSLERQNKDLKSRLSHLEGSQRTNQDSLVSKLNSRIQELEERLQGEERENNNLQQVNRKLERKVKEMKIQADEEHINLQSQMDQLTQRLKTAKRQMDEAEEEIERLEHTKKKLQRDVDEQMEANEQLHGQLNTLRKKKSPPFMKLVEEDLNDTDDFGSD
uniref:Myosin tail domain-containing protein n=1 Tax=Xiphophorus couchianus TaxID=32473 RepID=A0A3B5MEU9_9TELE